jgi:uncharacterized protein
MSSDEIKGLLLAMVQALVDRPDEIQINDLPAERAFVFELRVAGGDLGKVIGRAGKTAAALRTILDAAAGKHHKRSILEILE